MWIAIASLSLLGLTLGALLGAAGRLLKEEGNGLKDQIEALLPGSQCGQCGLPGCGPAAQAIAQGKAPLTACLPGGRAVALKIAQLLSVPLDVSQTEEQVPLVAFIHEELCIGCIRCLPSCSSDAIVGAAKMIHQVVAEVCHGCRKCEAICPTQAVEMRRVATTLGTWYWHKPARYTQPRPPATSPQQAAVLEKTA